MTRSRSLFALIIAAVLVSTTHAQQPVRFPPTLSNGSLTTANAGTCSETGTACVVLGLGGYAGVSVQITGTWAGTIQFEATNAAPNSTASATAASWVTVNMFPPSSTTAVTSTTANGMWNGTVIGTQFRVRMSTATSGTATVRLIATLAQPLSTGGGGGGGSGTVTSVDLTVPGGFAVTGNPVTSAGTLAIAADGTSGGVPYYASASTMASSAALTANLPVIGGGAGAAPSVGTRSGNTTAYVTTTGAQTSGDCVKIDANGNHVANGSACGSGGGSPGGADTQVQFNDSGSFGGDSGFTFNKAANTLVVTGAATVAGLNMTYVTKTANYTLTSTDGTVNFLTNAATATLPTAAGIQGRIYVIANYQTANAVTIDGNGSETVCASSGGGTTYTLTNGALVIQSDNTNWQCLSDLSLALTSLTSGGVIYASSTSAVASSALLAANAPVLGGGAGTAPSTVAGITSDGVSKLTLGEAGTSVGSVAFKNATSGTITVSPVTGALGTVAQTLPARAGVHALETGSTFTTGTIILSSPIIFDAGVSQGGTASIGLSTPATHGASAIAQNGAAGGNAAYGVASFDNTEVAEVQGHFPLTSDWSSSQGIDLQIKWRALSTTGNDVRFQIRTKCVATGEADTAVSYNAAQSTAAVTNLGTTLQWNSSSQTGLTLTTCSAGEEFFFIVSRDTSVSGDTLDQPVQVATLLFTIRRTVTIGG